ncbi:FG-GAP-like repeat-containing protein [Bradyrhizobium prioriisuperbiae]|uniref:FG-GAP-like repeat-containing protein n=1 Tax=Bradyrhizobium prioriisuperbiae TaxID=2854389 RepID=UPI0028E29C2A|nr:FG-GAP-like repeat-containing protein [Bradyrhizobium prioritasuperba]
MSRRLLAIASLLVLITACLSGFATAQTKTRISQPTQPSGVQPSSQKSVAQAQQGGSSANSRSAAYHVSANGAATYALPIRVAPGTQKLQPNLSFAYSSQGGNGSLGVGWGLSGLSQITRCGANYATDGFASGVNYNANDRFCLDGARLMNVAGAKASPYYQDGSVYHTQIESWRNVVANAMNDNGSACGSGPCWFAVTLKDGTQLEYGRANGAQFLALDAAGQNLFGSGGSKQGSVRAWALNKITDRNGNSIALSYTSAPMALDGTPIAGAGGVGAYYISRIDYTANASASPATVAQRSVQFFYAGRPDPTTQYQGGARVTTGARLAKIMSCLNAGAISLLSCSASGVSQVASYALTYCDQDTACMAGFSTRTGRSVLYSLVECGADGTTCLPANLFTWQSGPNTVQNVNGATSSLNTVNAVCASTAVTSWADFNGDGLPDWICNDAYNTGTVKVLLASLGGAATLVAPTGASPDGTLTGVTAKCSNGSVQWTSFTASGDVDWVCYDNQGYFYVLESNGSTVLPTKNGDPSGSATPGRLKGNDSANYVQALCPSSGNVAWADFNGDGFADWICTTGTSGNLLVYVLLSNGETLSTIQGATPTQLSNITPIQVPAICANTPVYNWVDFNGDGLADLTCSDPLGGGVSVFLSTGTGMVSANPANTAGQVTGSASCQGNAAIQWADINGDGLPDWTCVATNLSSVSMLVATGANLVNPDPAAGSPGSPATASLGCGGDTRAMPAWADFNGDGLADLICYAPSFSSIYFQLSSGTGIQAAPSSPMTSAASCSGTSAWMDFNGDRLVDWVCTTSSTGGVNVLVGSPSYPDLATTMTSSLGGQVSVSYAPLTNAAVYGQLAVPEYPSGKVLGFPQLYILDRVPLYVVSSYTLSNDAARNASNYSYRNNLYYTNGRVGLRGLGWQGFETVAVYDASVGNNLTLSFLQNFPFTGKISSAVACTAASASQQCSNAGGTQSTLYTVRQAYFCEAGAGSCQQDPRYAPLGPDAGVAQVLLVKKGAAHASFGYRLEQLYNYDSYGNGIYQANFGDIANGVKPLYTCSSYSNSQSPWRIGFMVNQKQSISPTCPAADAWSSYQYDSSTDLSWTQTAYDGKQNVSASVRWDDRNNGWLGKVVGRDAAGIGNITSVATTNQSGGSPATVANTSFAIGYDPIFNTFAQTVTTPLADPANSGSALMTTLAYDARFGTRVGSKGPNGVVNLSCVDVLGSASVTQGPLGDGGASGTDVNCLGDQSAFYGSTGVSADFTGATVTTLSATTWSAGNAAIVQTTTSRTDWANAFASAKTRWIQTFLDGLGRPYRRIAQGDNNQNSAIDISFLTRKRIKQVSLPYAAGTSPASWISAAYDQYGRKKRVTVPYAGRDASAQPAAQPCSADDIATTSTICWDYAAPNTTMRTAAANTDAPDISSTEFLFFNGGRKTTTLTNQGGTAVTSYSFDNLGRPISVVDPLGAVLTVKRDSLGRAWSVTDNANGTATTSYNTLGQLLTLTDAVGGASQFTYDGLGRTKTTSISGALGELAEVISYTYDAVAPSAAPGVGYGNLKGRRSGVSAAKQRGGEATSAYAFGYDSYGRANVGTLTSGAGTATVTGTTTPLGAPLQVSYPDTAKTTLSYGYTATGWPASVSLAGSGAPLVSYSNYTMSGQPQTVTYSSGVVEKFSFTPLGQVQNHSVWGKGASVPNLMANTYVWSHLGHVAQLVDCTSSANAGNGLCNGFPTGTSAGSTNLTETYSYTFDRLTSAVSAQYGSLGYQYHTNGNLTQTSGAATTTYQYKSVGAAETYQVLSGSNGFNARYDRRGNMTFKQTPSGDKWSYVYDARGRLIEARKNGKLVERYLYDYRGQRLQKITYATDGKTVVATTDYIGSLMVTTSGSSAGSVAQSLNLLGPSGFIGTRSSGGTASKGIYFHRNPLTQSTRLVTDGTSGMLLSSMLYQPYGATVQVTPGNSGAYRSKFQSHELDQATGLYYFGARYYDPAIGRFVTGDKQLGGNPLQQDAFNRYAMVLNNPVMMWDPDGRQAGCNATGAVLGVVGFVAGGVLGGASSGITAEDNKAFLGIAGATLGAATLGGLGGIIAPLCNALVSFKNRVTGRGAAVDDPDALLNGALEQVNQGIAGLRQERDTARQERDAAYQQRDAANQERDQALDQLGDANAERDELRNQLGTTVNERDIAQVQANHYRGICEQNGFEMSLAHDTPISVNGGIRPISDIRIGDKVWAFDAALGRPGLYPVTRLHERTAPGVLRVTIEDQVTEVTAEHPFKVQGRGWVRARHLKVGDRLVVLSGSDRVVTKVEPVPGAVKVYNFEVSAAHSYYAGGVLVHNGGASCDAKSSDKESLTGDAASESAAADDVAASAVGDTVEAGVDVAAGVEVGVDTAAAAGGSASFADVLVSFLALLAL